MSDEKRGVEAADMAKVPFLAGLLPAEAEALCAAAEERVLPKDEVAFEEGDPGQELWVIIEGEVGIELDLGGSSPQVLTTLGPGTVFGEINFLLGSSRTATARALRSTRCMVFHRDAVDRLEGIGRQALANVMETIARVLALRLTTADREMARMAEQLRDRHPEAAGLLDELGENRGRLLHAWQG